MTYDETVDYIESIPKFTTKTSLDHTWRILDRLGHPEEGMRIIHVAGTNGKGSVCAYLNSMLMEGGYRVGLFTSPHLIRINERYQINGEMVSDAVFTEAFDRVMAAAKLTMAEGDAHPTYFETLFLMGLLIFREEQADYTILEVGMGGRLDATNVIRRPLASIITSISLDHTEYLGDTIPKIASEKAGIIKEGVPVIFDGHDREAAGVIRRRAEELGAPCFELTPGMYHVVQTSKKGVTFDLELRAQQAASCRGADRNGERSNAGRTTPDFALAGLMPDGRKTVRLEIPQIAEYQMMNASLAFYTMELLEKDHGIPEEKLAAGLSKMQWPCRMETVLPDVVIDGAHNADGIAEFVRTVEHFHKDQEITLLFSCVRDKRYQDMIRELVEGIRPDRVITTRISGYREVSEDELAELFRDDGAEAVFSEPSPERAFDLGLALKGDGMLFCVGSLYLAGELKAYLNDARRN